MKSGAPIDPSDLATIELAKVSCGVRKKKPLGSPRQDLTRRERARRWRLNNKDKVDAIRNRYPEKRRANHAVFHAVRSGRLQKQPCEKCGTVDRVNAHHDDYSKPLEVRWLCPKHHSEVHYNKAG
jgi:ribosomal protein S27AE